MPSFFAVLAILSVLVCLFGWKLGGYVEKGTRIAKMVFPECVARAENADDGCQGCAEGIHTGVLEPVEASGVILEETEQMSELVEELLRSPDWSRDKPMLSFI